MPNTLILVTGLLAAAILMIVVAAGMRSRDRLDKRLAVAEHRLAAIAEHLGVAEPELDTFGIVAHLAAGRTAEAVSLYRRQTGAGLVEAKEAVDVIAGRIDGETEES